MSSYCNKWLKIAISISLFTFLAISTMSPPAWAACSPSVTRSKDWGTSEVLTDTDLEAEYDRGYTARNDCLGPSGHKHNDTDSPNLDWDDIWSDAAHDHSDAAEGGASSFDWDSVWTDAVHSHESAGEGGTVEAHASTVVESITVGLISTEASSVNQILTVDGDGGASWSTPAIWVRDGVQIANNGSDANNDIDVDYDALTVSTNGDADGALSLLSDGNFTAALDGSAGCNAIDTSSESGDTWYYVWVISKANGSTPCVVLSTASDFPSVTLPVDYTSGRIAGVIRNNGSSNIIAFDHPKAGHYYRFRDPIKDVSDSTMENDTGKTGTLTVPPNTLAHVRAHATESSGTTVAIAVFPTNASDDTANLDEASFSYLTASSTIEGSGVDLVLVDSSSQMKYMVAEATAAIATVNTLGFWDNYAGE
ncbi:hypothetical protein LCGC14_0714060 [marine sediment metagenome]|uniref:Uncharacterized protein n=1 Tax=marine sediment metagenome TaxID=412755 RepID=A0A0F9TLP5_9ZZZZ